MWFFVIEKLKIFYKFHLIGLPGYRENKSLSPMKIDKIIQILYYKYTEKFYLFRIFYEWLIASYFALSYPEHTSALYFL